MSINTSENTDKSISENIKMYFRLLTDSGRERLINELDSDFCLNCGIKQPKNFRCQCRNDE
jgi:hypothetical protein